MEQILAILRDGSLLIMTFGYAGIFLAMLVEGSGVPLPFPGTFLLAFVGYTIWNGNLDLLQASLSAAAGSTCGAWLLYRVARDAGPLLVANHGHRLALTQEKLSGAQSWFRVHAGRATFFARMTPGARIYISIAAGLARMRQGWFILATFGGTWLWSVAFILLGLALGGSWDSANDVLSTVQASLLGFAVLIIAGVAILKRRSSERDL